MGKFFSFFATAAILSIPILAYAECSSVFSSPLSAEAKWREATTQPSPNGTVAKTSKEREESIQEYVADFNKTIKEGHTPFLELFPAEGVDEDSIRDTPGYGSGVIQEDSISKLPKDGVLHATLLLTVSGHVGFENAKKWSTMDTYTVTMQPIDAKGNGVGPTTTLVKDVKSLDFVTLQEVEIPMKPGQIVRLAYIRSGSLGPAGYAEGRLYDLLWDGT